jgi:phospho-N-acetylmuramoyl-pentapeptide-transferase
MLYYLADHLRAWLGKPDDPYFYTSPLFRSTCAIVLAFLITVIIGPRLIRLLVRLKIGDRPEFDHATMNQLMEDKANVPTMGGLIIMIAVAGSTCLLAKLNNFYVVMGLFCLVWLSALGMIDDWLKLTASRRSGTRTGLRTVEKLLFQIGLGVILAGFIYNHGEQNVHNYPGMPEHFRTLMIPFYKGDPTMNNAVSIGRVTFMIIAVIVIAGTSNAVNLTDGMDGLAGGCMAAVATPFFFLTVIVGNERWADSLLLPYVPLAGELGVLCASILGACMGFLWFNCHPARVFMGDTGSLPLGGLMGYVAIVIRQELMLFIIGGIFVIEALSVLLQVGYFKMSGGKRIFRMAPIHYHFRLGGWTETQTVVRFWLITMVFAALALASIYVR